MPIKEFSKVLPQDKYEKMSNLSLSKQYLFTNRKISHSELCEL